MAEQTDIAVEMEDILNSFDFDERREALVELAQTCPLLVEEGSNVNMHFHSFFSYNAEGWSPARIAWESHKAGLLAAGLCDFDVIDGLEEFIEAGLLLGLRTTVNLETRAFLKEFAGVDINSPGEPGVTYIMGAGFARKPGDGSPQAAGLAEYRDRARTRNIALINRINPRLQQIAIDYERNVLPLTPGGCATERHIIRAYINKSKSFLKHADAAAGFWSTIIGKPLEETASLMADTPTFEEVVRSKLAKKGGIGYEQPSPTTFPPVDEFINWVVSCGAIPMITWLDGTSAGEKDGRAMLECLKAKGAAAINIIPDRNWNISNPQQKAVKVANLAEIVKIADSMNLPINIGTEMNKLGLPFADDLAGEVLSQHKSSFIEGALVMVGHSLLLRYANYSYVGAGARAEYGNLAERNDFFAAVGELPPIDMDIAKSLNDMGPDKALAWFRDKTR